MGNNLDTYFMWEALKEAQKAFRKDEVPVGCILVKGDKIIARAHNQRQKKHDVLGHAEILAIKKASKKLHAWILDDVTMYVTLEPCLMCAGAILQARIAKVIYATAENKFGVLESKMQLFSKDGLFNHHVYVQKGPLQDVSSTLLKQYFKEKRKIDKQKPNHKRLTKNKK